MISKFFIAQWDNPSKNDWTVTIQNDLQCLNIKLNLEKISSMKKEKFAELIKGQCKHIALDELLNKKKSHSKMVNIEYSELNLQKWYKSKLFHSTKAKSLFKWRTRMKDFRNNLKKSFADLNCPLCKMKLDDQEHILACDKIKESVLKVRDTMKTCLAQIWRNFRI